MMRVVTLLVGLLIAPAIQAQTLVGEWKLVEQTYGEGQSNLVEAEAGIGPLRLEFSRRGGEIVGTIRAGDDAREALSWPRLVADRARRVHIEEKRFAATRDRVLVRYRVDPSPGDDLVLEVTEEYGLAEEGQALVGTVRVGFKRGGKAKGSYVLHRRFERVS